MEKIIARISLIVTLFMNLQSSVSHAQCFNNINESDSLEMIRIQSESSNDYFEFDFIDTLGECRVSYLLVSKELSGFDFDFPYLKVVDFEMMDFKDGFEMSGYPNLNEINIYSCGSAGEIRFSNLDGLAKMNIGSGYSFEATVVLENLNNLEILELGVYAYKPFNPVFFDHISVPNLKKLIWNGEFLPNIPNFPYLEELEIYPNISGPGPTKTFHDFSNFPSLQKLLVTGYIFDNSISESNFDKLSELKELHLSYNQFNGSIPNFNNPKLEILDLVSSNFNGSIANFDNVPLLRELYLARNQLAGTIPNFEHIPLLEKLSLSRNQLTGIVPNFDNLPLLNQLTVCGENDFIEPIPSLENCPLLNTNEVDFTCVRPAPENTGCFVSESDSLELVNFYQSTNGDNWQVNTGWLVENISSWWGIEIIDTLGRCRVTKMLIRGIPDTVALPGLNLPFLEELILDYNNFTDELPDISNLTNLKVLNLGNNHFEGDLPNLSYFTELEEINLSRNKLTGVLPDFTDNLLLREINLSDNLITGILSDFQAIPNLNYLNVSGNQLTGVLPDFSNLPNLYTLNCASNQLSGQLPNFSNLPVLQSLLVQNNQLTGRVPNFSNTPFLEELVVCDNNLEGTVPNFSFATLLNLDGIDFSCLQAAKVQGYVYYDVNENCIFDENDITIPNGVVSINNGANYQPIDENGYYEIPLEIGSSVITFIQTSSLWQSVCQDTYTITSASINDITNVNFANLPNVECTELTIDIGTPFLRRCFKNTYTINYCNQGTQPASDAYVEIDFDNELIPLSASLPYEINGNVLSFQIGEVGIGECGSFSVVDSVACDAPIWSTGCVEAHIYPDNYCQEPSNLWDYANLSVNAFCLNNDSVQFIIENSGDDMENPSVYRMYEEDVLAAQGEFILPTGVAKVINYNATGITYRMIVEQTPGHPSQDNPQAFFEFCGDGNFSTGYINSQLLPDKDEFIDIDCEEIIGSYDPNDKLVTPAGVGESHDIYKGDELTYKIRFQNTGNDTAFTVVLVDTLDFEHLNISTLEVLNSSHPYSLSVEDAQILNFTFSDILLVDSTTNEPASHGFITFKINQFKENEIGDVIENKAYIYFDYTNFQIIPLFVGVENGTVNHLFAKVYPNPASEMFYIELPGEILHQYCNLKFTIRKDSQLFRIN